MMLLLKMFLFVCLREAVVVADNSIQEEMLRCGGNCTHEQYLVCGSGGGSFRSFPNHCYMEAISGCNFDTFVPPRKIMYSAVPDEYCNYHNDYIYFEVFTCEKALEKAKDVKAAYFSNMNSVFTKLQLLLGDKDELLSVIDQQTYDLGNNLKITLLKSNVQSNVTIGNAILRFYQSNCSACSEKSVFDYSNCLSAEINTVNSLILDIQYFFDNIKKVSITNKVDFVNNLNKLNLVVINFNEYFNKRLLGLSKLLISTRQQLEYYIIPDALYLTGNTLIKSLQIANQSLNNSVCEKYLHFKLNQLSESTEEIITPYSESKYLLPSLEIFLNKYGDGIENKSVLDLITNLENTFISVENKIKYESNDVGITEAYGRLSLVIGSLNKILLQKADCLESSIKGDNVIVYTLLKCLSVTNQGVGDILLVKKRVVQCYVEYKTQYNCLKYTPVTSSQELARCLSLTLASSDSSAMDCCFR